MQPIYGADRAHKWAWKFNNFQNPLAVNEKTVLNADNYGLMYIYETFSQAFGWDINLANSTYDVWENTTDASGEYAGVSADDVTIPPQEGVGNSSGCRLVEGEDGLVGIDCSNVVDFIAPSGCRLTYVYITPLDFGLP